MVGSLDELIEQYPGHPHYPVIRKEGLRQVIGGPLRQGGQSLGLLCFWSKTEDFYTESMFPLFQAIADQLAVAVSNVLANEQLVKEKQFNETLLDISEAVASIYAREELLKTIFQQVKPIFGFYDVGLFVLDDEGYIADWATVYPEISDSAVNQAIHQSGTEKTTFDGSVLEWTFNQLLAPGGPVILPYSKEVFSRFPEYYQWNAIQEVGYQEAMVTLLTSGGQHLGILMFNSLKADFFLPSHFPLFQAIADQLAVAVANVLANERLTEEKKKTEDLLAVTAAIANISSGPELVRAIFDRLQRVFPFDEAGLFHLDFAQQQERDLIVDYGYDASSASDLLREQGLSGWLPLDPLSLFVAQHGPVVMSTEELYQRFDHPHFGITQTEDFRQIITGPLRRGEEAIGLLYFWSKTPGAFDQTLPLFTSITDQLSVALSNIIANEELERRERFKSLQVALMRLFELSHQLKDNFTQFAPQLRQQLPYDLLVIASYGATTGELKGGSYFWAESATGHWFSERPLSEVVPDDQLLRHWGQEADYRVRILNGIDFAESLPPSAPVREAYQQLAVRSALVGNAPLNAERSLLVAAFSYQPNEYRPEHQELLHRLLPTFQIVIDRSLAYHKIRQLNERLQEENTYLEEEIKVHYNFGEIVGESPAIQQVFAQVQQVATTDSTVLVLGETGTGKELVARALHEQSPRRDKTLIKINCAALPPQLIESELFGHERGAFTGAVQRRIGKFELADGGTLFLDEVGELPLELQAKLLRVLQEKSFERLGSNQLISTDARIVAATNRDLTQEVKQGNFRADLFYRLNVFPIHLPPLRERVDDIAPLAQHFVHRYARKFKKPSVKRVAAQTIAALTTYSFPGNVRELEHLIERAVIVAQTQEVSFTLPESSSPPDPVTTSNGFKMLRDNEREMILRVLAHTGGKIRGVDGAAAILDINPTTLESRMERLGIEKQTRFV